MGAAFDCFFAMHQQETPARMRREVQVLACCTALLYQSRPKLAKRTSISERRMRFATSFATTHCNPAAHFTQPHSPPTPHRYLAGDQT